MADHLLMKYAKVLMCVLGLWPTKLTGNKLKLYNAYFYLSFGYYILFDCTQAIRALMIMGKDLGETATNLGVTIVYVINIYKMTICKSEKMKRLIHTIEEKEKQILGTDDEHIHQIYMRKVKLTHKTVLFFVSYGSAGISTYFANPIVQDKINPPPFNNETQTYVKSFIFSSWFPFDEYKHYVPAYLIQLLGGCFGYAYIVYGGAFIFSILLFCVSELEILQHMLRNFSHYARKYQKSHNVSYEKAQRVLVRLIIKQHQEMIDFVGTLDNALRLFMLLDFIISSFQLSLLVFQMLLFEGGVFQTIMVYSYLSTLIMQLFFVYWNAHDIIVQSSNLAHAAFESEWITYTEDVKKCFQMIIMRSQKPLALHIGPINQMRVDALLSIFKAIYSYVALIQKSG